jgi:predicted dehydrogenase
MSPKPLHVCLIGCGSIGEVHVRAYQELQDAWPTRLSFCDTDKARVEEVSRKFGGLHAFQNWEDACAARDVDVLDLCLPHHLHVQAMKVAAFSGKHVLLEKPIARDLKETDVILQFTQGMKTKFMVSECWRFYSHILKSQELIQAGEVGEVFLIETCSLHRWLPPGWRRGLRENGGGALMDRGVHFVDMLLSLGGPVKTVFSLQTSKNWAEMEGDDTSVLTLKYASGAMGNQIIGWGTHEPREHAFFTVHGTQGTLQDGAVLRLLRQGEAPRDLTPPIGSGWPDYTMIRDAIAHFMDCVVNDKTPIFTPAMARADIEVVTAAYQSNRLGKSIDLPYVGPGACETW